MMRLTENPGGCGHANRGLFNLGQVFSKVICFRVTGPCSPSHVVIAVFFDEKDDEDFFFFFSTVYRGLLKFACVRLFEVLKFLGDFFTFELGRKCIASLHEFLQVFEMLRMKRSRTRPLLLFHNLHFFASSGRFLGVFQNHAK